MTPKEARNAIAARLLDAYQGVVPVALDNQKFEPPQSGAWMRLSVQLAGGGQETLGPEGSRRHLRGGVAFVQVFTPVDSATNASDDLAGAVLRLMEGFRSGGLWTYGGALRTAGADGKWYQQNVSVEFRFEETN